MRRTGLLFFGLLVCNLVFGQAVIYVSPDGAGDGSGSNWANASNIENAITTAPNNTELRLRGGTYNITTTLIVPLGRRLIINGGYTGVDENQRDWVTNPSVLDGDNTTHIMIIDGDRTEIHGVEFRRGFLTGVGGGGGAIYLRAKFVSIQHSVFSGNFSSGDRGGGAIFINHSSQDVVISDCLFENNRNNFVEYPMGQNGGGAIHNWSENTLIRNTVFRNNVAENSGGAVYTWGEGFQLIDCDFIENHSDQSGGAIHVNGQDVNVTNGLFENNSSGTMGGAVNNQGDLLVNGAAFRNNKSTGNGGAINNNNGTGTIHSTDFIQNETERNGGAVYNNFDTLTVTTSNFAENKALENGGAIGNNFGVINIRRSDFTENNSQVGGAIYNHRFAEPSLIEHVTFSENSATQGGAIYNFSEEGLLAVSSLFVDNEATDMGGAIFNNRFIEVTNATFVRNTNTALIMSRSEETTNNPCITHVYNSIFYLNTAKAGGYRRDIHSERLDMDLSTQDVRRNILQEYVGTNNQVGVDPLFVNNTNDFRLQTSSPAANAGNDALFDGISPTAVGASTDLANEPRLFGTAIDLGVYELQDEREQQPQTITVTDLTVTYGDPPFVHGESDSGLPLTYSSSDPDVAVVIEDSEIWITGVGTAIITVSQAGNNAYLPADDVDFELTVEPAPLTIRANDDSKTNDGVPYDGGNGVTYDGFAYGEDESVLTGSLTYTGNAQGATDVGVYEIMPDGLSSTNYAITYESGTLTITALNDNVLEFNVQTANVTVGAVYGDLVVDGSATASSGLPVSYSSSTPAVATVNADGEVQITGVGSTVITATQAGDDDYEAAEPISFTFEVTPAPLTIRANDDSKTYDGVPYDGGNGVTYESFVYGEDEGVLTGSLTYTGNAQGATDVDVYEIMPDGLSSTNYAISYESGTLTITAPARPEPPQADDQRFCPPATVADLVAVGTDVRWYGQATGGTALPTMTALSTGTYYATQTAGGMESDRRAVAVTVEAPSAPQFNGDITGCGNLTVADLEDIETGLRWYSQATGGTALSSTEAVSSGTFYASRVSGTCESDRTAVQVIITITPVPDVPNQNFVVGSTFADLNVIGQNLQWYTEPSGSTPFDPPTVISNGTYYVSQTIDGCESDRVIVQINITPVPGCVTSISPADHATNVSVGANITWDAVAEAEGYRIYIGTASGSADVVHGAEVIGTSYNLTGGFDEGTTYYVIVIPYNDAGEADGCTEISFTTEAEEEPTPVTPECTVIILPTDGATDVDLNATITWEEVDSVDGYLVYVGTTPGGTEVVNGEEVTGTTYTYGSGWEEGMEYYVAVVPFNAAGEATGCPEISFTTVARPGPPQADDQQFCPLATVADLVAVGADIRWYGQVTGGSPLSTTTVLSTGTYYATQTVGGLESDRRMVAVAVESPVAPQFVGDITGCGSLTIADLEDVSTGLRWYNQAIGGTALSLTTALSTGTYYASRISGTCESDRTAVQVIIRVTPVPDVPDQRFVVGNTFADLNIIGQNLRWYTEPSGSTSFDPQTVISNGTYYVSQMIDGCESDRVIVQINITPIPGCVTNISPADNAANVSVNANIIWDAVAEAAGYRISIGTIPGGTDIADNVEVTAGTSFDSPVDFPQGETIYVTVVPYNAEGSATGCSEISFTTEQGEVPVPEIPGCTVITNPVDGDATSLESGIIWNSVAGAEGYRVTIGTAPDIADLVDGVEVVGTAYHPTFQFAENTTYYITVTPFNSSGEAKGCGQLRFTVIPDNSINRTKYGISPNGDGINDYWSIDGIEQYPDNTVSIFNRWGDMVFQIHGYDNEFKVFNGVANKLTRLGGGVLPAGTYFFAIRYREGKETKTVEGFLVLRR